MVYVISFLIFFKLRDIQSHSIQNKAIPIQHWELRKNSADLKWSEGQMAWLVLKEVPY